MWVRSCLSAPREVIKHCKHPPLSHGLFQPIKFQPIRQPIRRHFSIGQDAKKQAPKMLAVAGGFFAVIAASTMFSSLFSKDNKTKVEEKQDSQQKNDQKNENEAKKQAKKPTWSTMEIGGREAVVGDQVSVHWLGTRANGQVFGGTHGTDPVKFEVGAGEMLSGVDAAVVGMKVGEKKKTVLSPAEAFGEKSSDAVISTKTSELPKDTKVGTVFRTADGRAGVVVEVGESETRIDMSHPLAGENVTVEFQIVKLGPGVKIDVIKQGDGVRFPKPGDTLTMHYTGTLASNGKKFDSSQDRSRPLKFIIGVGQVIKGWDKGVLKMSLGERSIIHIPASLGYGERGASGVIPPNTDLVFDCELLNICGPDEYDPETLNLE